MDKTGLIFQAEKEIRLLLERQPNGMTIKDINDKSYSYHKLNRLEKPKALELLTKSGVIVEYKIIKGFGNKPETIYLHGMHGTISKFMGFDVIRSDSYSELAYKVRNKDVAGTAQLLINNKQEDKMTFVSSADLKKQAELLLAASKEAEKREKDLLIKENVMPLQLTIAKSVCLIQKHVDGLVDSMSELEKASEALRKVLAN